MNRLSLIKNPELHDPVIFIGLAGWADAGNVSSLSIYYLREITSASYLGSIDMSDHIDLTHHRPIVTIENGMIKEITMPSFDIYYSILGDRDLITINGYEPINGWSTLIKSIFELAEKMGSTQLLTIGGLIDRVPHTRPVKISFLASSPRMHRRALELGLNPSNYSGPGSIHSFIMNSSAQIGLDALSIWGHVPNYVNMPNPRVILSVLEKAALAMEISINLERLYFEASVFDGRINSLIEQDASMREMLEELEREYDERDRRPEYIK